MNSSPGGAQPWGVLTVVQGPDAGRSFTLRGPRVLVGREVEDPLRDVLLTGDPHISRAHGYLEFDGTTAYYTDAGSSHGSCLNGQRLGAHVRVPLPSASVLQLGPATLVRYQASARGDSQPMPSSATPAGETVPGYRCDTLLHRGELCSIWRGTDVQTGLPVAIKLLEPPPTLRAQAEVIFRRESALSLTLRHPYIVRYLAAGEHRGLLYLAMEYIDGLDGRQLVQARGGALPADEVVVIGLQALDALTFAHVQGIVHRDIKPSNLLFDRATAPCQVKLADFGIARVYRAARLSGITRLFDLRGTFEFMPPEQAFNSRGVDQRADLFSLAATLCYLLTGQLVYDFPPGSSRQLVVSSGKIVPVDARGIDIPPRLASCLQRALQADIDARYSDAAQMRMALGACAD